MSCAGGRMSGRDTLLATRVYVATSAASETSQMRNRCVMRRLLSADGIHDFLVLDHRPRISAIDDLASIDGIEPVGDPGGIRQVRLGDQDRDRELLDLLDRLD